MDVAGGGYGVMPATLLAVSALSPRDRLLISWLQVLVAVPFVPGSWSQCFQPGVHDGAAGDFHSPAPPTENSQHPGLANQIVSEFSQKGRCVFPGFLEK